MVQWRARGGDFRGSIVGSLQDGFGWNGMIGVDGLGAEDTETQKSGDGSEMWVGRHGRG